MRAELEQKQPVLIASGKETAELIALVEAQTAEADKVKTLVQVRNWTPYVYCTVTMSEFQASEQVLWYRYYCTHTDGALDALATCLNTGICRRRRPRPRRRPTRSGPSSRSVRATSPRPCPPTTQRSRYWFAFRVLT